jgi:hypothetical protein
VSFPGSAAWRSRGFFALHGQFSVASHGALGFARSQCRICQAFAVRTRRCPWGASLSVSSPTPRLGPVAALGQPCVVRRRQGFRRRTIWRMRNVICPYTCLPIESIDASREHIVPDALGGANGFALVADRVRNGQYGEGVDSRLIHSPLVSLMAVQHGVVTRSGDATLRQRGTLTEGGDAVDATFSKDEVSFRLRTPVVCDEAGNLVAVRGFGDAAAAELRRIERDFKKKGRTVVAGEPSALGSEVKVGLAHNFDHVKQGLAKIAYLATVWTLGDAFISTAAAARFRAYIDAEPTPSALEAVGLRVDQRRGVGAAMPNLPAFFHVITCMREGSQVATMVRLFNTDLLTATFVVTTPELPVAAQRTRLMAVNAVDKSLEDHDIGAA